MTKLVWDETGSRIYETGTKNGVLYPYDSELGTYPKGVAWNGLTAVTESPSGADESAIYADDMKYGSLRAAEEFGATIEAYTYPDEFEACDGTAELGKGVVIGQQSRNKFGLSYKTVIGNDTELNEHGYKIHLIYGCTAAPSEKDYATINDSPDAISFSWDVTADKVNVNGHKPTACITIDSTKCDPTKLAAIEKILYGDTTEASVARLPLPDEIITLLGANA